MIRTVFMVSNLCVVICQSHHSHSPRLHRTMHTTQSHRTQPYTTHSQLHKHTHQRESRNTLLTCHSPIMAPFLHHCATHPSLLCVPMHAPLIHQRSTHPRAGELAHCRARPCANATSMSIVVVSPFLFCLMSMSHQLQ